MKSGRLNLNQLIKAETYWSDAIAEEVKNEFPEREIYTTAAGISPSGIVHFGNFRDVITSYAVCESLKKLGLKSRCIFSWDNFDRLRKIPSNVDKSFQKYIGMPLSKVPSPIPGFSSYAEYFQAPFEKAMMELGIKLEYIDQTKEYESGRYDEIIFLALQKRKEIAKILLSFMSDKGKQDGNIDEKEYIENYYPISVYSRFTGKDIVKVLDYDGKSSITYECIETGKTETVDLTKERIAKLAWKIDWPMRWQEEGVVFEPAGHDHASPGGSYDVAEKIAIEVFHNRPPLFLEYKFVGIVGLGSKMSGSKGNAISPAELLEIYEPAILKWLYLKKRPDQAFSLAFDSEIYRQYDEFDREAGGCAFELANTLNYKNPIPFKQAVALGQITQWDKSKVTELIKDLKENYDPESIRQRLPKARAWLEKHNANELIKLNDAPNSEYAKILPDNSREHVRKLREELEKKHESIEDLENLVYEIPKKPGLSDKENSPLQKEFFKHVYNLLIGRDSGPRLSTFLWAVPREKVLNLLDI